MGSRKRRHSQTAEPRPDPGKRARPLEYSWNSLDYSPSLDDSPSCSIESTTSSYQINAIIGEREDEYLIDWAEDTITGESFEPDWQPKRNANTAAVNAWRAKRPLSIIANTARWSVSQEQRSHHRRLARPITRALVKGNRGIGTKRSSIASRHNLDIFQIPPDRHQQSSRSSGSTKEGDLIVRISQHSSLDQDLFPAYEACRSTQSTIISVASRTVSEINSISQGSQQNNHDLHPQSKIIPDSQSLPGSSSYQPNTSSGTADIYVSRDDLKPQALDREASNFPSSLIVPDSQESRRRTRRSTSAPLCSQTNSTGSSLLQTLTFPRSKSDPSQLSSILPNSQESSFVEIPDSAEKAEGATATQKTLSRISGPASWLDSPSNIPASRSSGSHLTRTRYNRSVAIGEDLKSSHPSQLTTTEESVLSGLQPNSQSQRSRSHWTTKSPHLSSGSPFGVENSQPTAISIEIANLPRERSKRDSTMNPVNPLSNGGEGSDTRHMDSGAPSQSMEQMQRIERDTPIMMAQQRERHRQAMARRSNPVSPSFPHSQPSSPKPPSRVTSPLSRSEGKSHSPTAWHERSSAFQTRSPIALQTSGRLSQIHSGPTSPLATQPFVSQDDSSLMFQASALSSPIVIPDRTPQIGSTEQSRLQTRPLQIETASNGPSQPSTTFPTLNTPVLSTPITPSKLSLHKEVTLSPSENVLEICNLSKRENVVPLAMADRIQQYYCSTIKIHARAIKNLMEENPVRRRTIEQINTLLDEVSKVTNHIDLLGSGPSNQDDLDPKAEADYAETCSEKFKFLRHLIDRTRNVDLNICVVANRGPLMNILRVFLTALEVKWLTWDEGSHFEVGNHESNLKILLVASDLKGTDQEPPLADLIVGFDETFDQHKLQIKSRKATSPPILRLVVYASLEHIDLCIPRSLDPVERFRRLVFPLLQTQQRVGSIRDVKPEYLADIIATSFDNSQAGNADRTWRLPPIQSIEGIAFMESDSSLSDAQSDVLEEYKPSGPVRYWPDPIAPAIKAESRQRGKRSHDIEWGDSLEMQAKKQKITQDNNGAHEHEQAEQFAKNLEYLFQQARSRVKAVESELHKKNVQAKDMQLWASIRQHDYEKLREELSQMQLLYSRAVTDLQKGHAAFQDVRARYDRQLASHNALNNQYMSLKATIDGNPNTQNAIAARNFINQDVLLGENNKLKKDINSVNEQLGYTRSVYQEANAAVMELTSQIQPLEREVQDLRRRQEDNVAEYRRRRDEDAARELSKEVRSLRTQLAQRENTIRKFEGDITELKRGRAGVQTRGSSVQPKSPARGGSRGVSPASGLLNTQGGHAMARTGSGRNNRFRD